MGKLITPNVELYEVAVEVKIWVPDELGDSQNPENPGDQLRKLDTPDIVPYVIEVEKDPQVLDELEDPLGSGDWLLKLDTPDIVLHEPEAEEEEIWELPELEKPQKPEDLLQRLAKPDTELYDVEVEDIRELDELGEPKKPEELEFQKLGATYIELYESEVEEKAWNPPELGKPQEPDDLELPRIAAPHIILYEVVAEVEEEKDVSELETPVKPEEPGSSGLGTTHIELYETEVEEEVWELPVLGDLQKPEEPWEPEESKLEAPHIELYEEEAEESVQIFDELGKPLVPEEPYLDAYCVIRADTLRKIARAIKLIRNINSNIPVGELAEALRSGVVSTTAKTATAE